MKKVLSVLVLLLAFGFMPLSAQNFSTHQVRKGETIESIAKRYYVTPFDIYELNPDAKKELKPNTVLIIPISKAAKPKVTIVKELRGFRTHKTRRKETLYSISKKYDVSEEDIKKHNKSLYSNPLRKGDELQIPIYETTEVEETSVLTKDYTVQPKEGKWRIAYKYGITIEELEALNPNMEEVLKEGEIIKVPNINQEEEKEVDSQYSYYKVLPKEGFYRLKIKLGLEQEALETLNPELKETGLKNGMILKIPYSSTALGGSGVDVSTPVNLSDSISDFKTKHIAVMLPFRLNRVDYDSVADTKRSIKKDPYLNASLDFYSGVLVALDSLKELGVSLKVDVYDTKYQVSEVEKIIDENDFESVDAVIGPLTSKSFNKASSALRVYDTPIISPIGSNLNLYENVFQSRSSDDLLKEKIVNFVKTDTLASNIIVVSDTDNTAVSNEIKQEFNHAKQVFSRKNKKSGKDEFFVIKEDIQSELKPGKNIVFLETRNEGYASNVTSILASLIQKEDKEEEKEEISIVLVTTNINAAFQGDQINNTHLSKLQFHYASSSKEYSEDKHKAFIKRYDAKYSITPNKRAVKGFDLTMDVALRLVSSENFYASVVKAPTTEYVESKFMYKKKINGGYYNEAVYLVRYDDLNIVEVEQ